MKERFARLSWFILESKYCYYFHPNFKHLSDTEYDKIEEEYKSLAKALGFMPTATDMVGFDENRASCKLVKERVLSNKSVSFKLLEE